MVNEDLKVNPALKKYIITFKRKDLRHNKTDDKVEILKKITGLGDFENYVNISALRPGDKKHSSNKIKTGRNETDRYNPITPNYETIHDINRYDFPVVMMKLTPTQYHLVRKDPNVEMIEEDSRVFMHMSATTPQQIPWGISRVKAPDAWTSSGKRGTAITVGLIDSGVESSHPDLVDNCWEPSATFVPGTTSAIDEGSHLDNTPTLYWHGTHIAGTIAALDNQQGVVGVAPLAHIHPVRIFGPTGIGTSQAIVISAMEWCMQAGLDITNNSYGGAVFSTAQQTQWQQAYDRGIILIAASGNEGKKTMDPNSPSSNQNYPSGYPAAIEVSATNETDGLASFTNYGTKTEFAAPGNNILSTYTMAQFGGYTTLSGTSMATPHVTAFFAMGLAAWRFSPCSDMYQQLGGNKVAILRKVAQQTADKMGKFADRDPNNGYGYGIPNVKAFTDKLLNPDIHIQTVA